VGHLPTGRLESGQRAKALTGFRGCGIDGKNPKTPENEWLLSPSLMGARDMLKLGLGFVVFVAP